MSPFFSVELIQTFTCFFANSIYLLDIQDTKIKLNSKLISSRKCQQRKMSSCQLEKLLSYKFLIFVIIIFRFPINKEHQENSKLAQLFQKDLQLCKECFEDQIKECFGIENQIVFTEGFEDSLNIMFGVRQTRYGTFKDNNKTVIKYLGNDLKGLDSILQHNESLISELFDKLFDSSRIEGLQMCSKTVFDKVFKTKTLSNLVYLNVDAQPLILPILHKHNLPVPKVFQTCGFTIFESYEGKSLTKFFYSPFKTRLQIAVQLLQAALQFTAGFDSFRVYLTDLNPDNIVYNPETKKLTFVDLDDIILVDSEENTIESHRHEMIECDGCFAYSQQSICAAKSSDINLFSACQFLREDLKGDKSKGFLHPIPEDILQDFPEMLEVLDYCIDCREGECSRRFDVVSELIDILNSISYYYL